MFKICLDMKKTLAAAITSFGLLGFCQIQEAKSQTVIDTITRAFSYAVAEDPTKTVSGGGSQINIYKLASDGSASLLVENLYPDGGPGTFTANDYAIDSVEGKIYFREPPRGGDLPLRARVFNIKTETLEDDWVTITGLPDGAQPIFVTMPDKIGEKISKKCDSTDGSTCDAGTNKVTLGGEGSSQLAIIDSDGISTGGKNLVKRVGDELHIGENSLVTVESGGRQKLYATDANGDAIDIDITNGSKLLINGRDVEKSIDNVGALSAALGSVPTISADSKFTCGFGAGTHSSAYAVSGGCASRVSERISLNAAVATVFNNHTGDFDDNLSARAGFTFRLGQIDDTPKIAAQKAAKLHDEVAKMREENAMLLARLQKLEQLASLQVDESRDLASR